MHPNYQETTAVFECENDRLIAIIAKPAQPAETGVVIIVGGPQYRAGSHRQFTLLARHLAENGIASIRFDYRGMGDSEGAFRNFEQIDPDIRAATNTLCENVPEIRKVALWGLCDAASAALYYGHTDPRVSKLILLNPWVHTPVGAAKARIKHYYLARLMQPAFWKKLISGKVRLGESVKDVASARAPAASTNTPLMDPRHGSPGYIDRMLEGMSQFRGSISVILSGNDLTAKEYEQLLANNRGWKSAHTKKKIKQLKVEDANHTFSTKTWREAASWRTQDSIFEK